jgi:UDP-N-acetyl-D-mannosaminuronate dehydrogenase
VSGSEDGGFARFLCGDGEDGDQAIRTAEYWSSTMKEMHVPKKSEYGGHRKAVDGHVDDHQSPHQARRVELTGELVASSNLIVLLTEHDGVDYGLLEPALNRVFDTRGVLRHAGELL